MILQRIEKHKIQNNSPFYKFFINVCINANNLYNHGNYLIRQKFIETTKLKEQEKLKNAEWLRYAEVDKLLKKDKDYPDYYDLPIAACSQQILRLLDKNWVSFFKSIKDWKKNPNKYTGRPKLPKYREKQKPFLLIVPKPYFKTKGNSIKLTKAFNNFEINNIQFNSKKEFKEINQLRFLPRKDYITVEIIYSIEVEEKLNKNLNRILSIDLGIDNLATITTNFHNQPILINGNSIKSENQWFNKEKARLQERQKKCYNNYTSKRLERLSIKRENKIKDYFHKVSKFIIDYCKENKIGMIIIGHNKNWKQNINIGKQTNQKFTSIPFNNLIQMIEYKATQNNIYVSQAEESYTSKASFIDNDKIPTLRDKSQKTFSGKRIFRGLYKTKNGSFINADVNGSYNIMRKVISDVEIPADRGLVNSPSKITLSNKQYKEYFKVA